LANNLYDLTGYAEKSVVNTSKDICRYGCNVYADIREYMLDNTLPVVQDHEGYLHHTEMVLGYNALERP